MRQKIGIIGAGLSGLITAIALADKGIPSKIFERSESLQNSNDPRTTSLNFKAVEILKEYGIWKELETFTSPIEDIYIIDNYSSQILEFHGQDVLNSNSKMGYLIENSIFREKLFGIANSNSLIEIIYDAKIKDVSFDQNMAHIYFERNSTMHDEVCDLVVACDGKYSVLREKFFSNSVEKSYNQQAIVFNISHEKPHVNLAIEHFMQTGPFAILPLKDVYSSSIVWTERNESADLYLKMPKEELEFFVQRKCGDFLGRIKIISDIVSYPLSAHVTSSYYYKNIALVADSAHSIHPLAGQGLNIGIKDVKSLVDIISRRINVGVRIDEIALAEYSRSRIIDNMLMFTMMDGLNLVFSNNVRGLGKFRRLGLSIVNKLPLLKKFFMRRAMGI